MTSTARTAARLRFNYRRLPPVGQAALWMMLGGIVGGLMNVVIRICGSQIHPLDASMLWILASAAIAAMGSITVKFLARTQSAGAIVAYMVIFTTPMALIPALFVWTWPSLRVWLGLALLGLFGTVAHFSVARA